jgi:hypothetical protein
MDDKHLDALFRKKLHSHEVLPSPACWSKLEQKLDEKKKPTWIIWGRFAAGFLLLLGLGISIRYWDLTLPESEVELVTEITNGQTLEPVTPIPTKRDTLSPDLKVPVPQQPERVRKKAHEPIKPTAAAVPGEQMATVTEEHPEEFLPSVNMPEMDIAKVLSLEEVTLSEQMKEINSELTNEKNEIAYTVKVVSRGYAIAPEKGQLVEEIENKLEKIGGFFTKVDKGFGDLQDAKNDLFTQVMASKKEK